MTPGLHEEKNKELAAILSLPQSDHQPQTLSQSLLASSISFYDTYHKLVMG